MKKFITILFCGVLLMAVPSCQSADMKKNSGLNSDVAINNQKSFDKTDIENYSFKNRESYTEPSINFYIDGDSELWIWRSNCFDRITGDFIYTETKPEIVINDAVDIIENGENPYLLKKDKSLWKLSLLENNNVSYIKILENVKYAEDSFAITENDDLYLLNYNPKLISDIGVKYEQEREPVKILDDIVYADITGSTSFAIDKDGNLWSWGYNTGMELGQNNDYIESAAPKTILDNVKTIVRSYDRGDPTIYAIKTDNTLWAWGNNKYGAVGNGTTEGVNVPVKIMDDVKDVTADAVGDGSFETYSFAYALKNDGTLWSWGYNGEGEAGNGTTKNVLSPVKILDDVAEIQKDNSLNISYALKEDGSLWGWGLNYYGQLGNGTTENVLEPIKIMDNVKSYEPYYEALYVIKEDGTLWGSGLNISYFIGEESNLKFIRLIDDVKNINKIDDIVFAIGNDGSLQICGYGNVTFIDSGRRTMSYIDKNKILDNIKWIDGYVNTMFAMTYNGELYCFVADEIEKGKILFTEPYKIEFEE